MSTYITTTGRRVKGYRSAVRDNGLDDSPELIFVSSESPEDAAAAGRKMTEPGTARLVTGPPPNAPSGQ